MYMLYIYKYIKNSRNFSDHPIFTMLVNKR